MLIKTNASYYSPLPADCAKTVNFSYGFYLVFELMEVIEFLLMS